MTKLILCIIFCTVLVIVHSKDFKSRYYSSRHKPQNRDNSEESSSESQEHLIFLYNSSTNFEGVYSSSSQDGAVADIKSNILLIFKEQSKLTVIIDYQNFKGVTTQTSNVKWDYFIHLTTLSTIFSSSKNQTTFDPKLPPQEISKKIDPILKCFSPKYRNLSEFINDVITSSKILKEYNKIFVSSEISIRDYHETCEELKGLNDLLEETGAKNKNQTLDLQKLLQESPNRLTYIIQQLTDRNRFSKFCSAFKEFRHTQSGNRSTSSFITTLIQIYSSNSNSKLSPEQEQNCLQDIQQTLEQLGLNNSFHDLAKILGDFDRGNSSANILRIPFNSDPQNGISDMVYFLTALGSRFQPQQIFSNFISQLVCFFGSGVSSFRIRNMIPFVSDPQIGSFINSLQNLFGDFMKFLEVAEDAFKNMADAWAHIPGLGLVFAPLNKAMEAATHGALTLAKIFQSPQARNSIRQFISNCRNSSSTPISNIFEGNGNPIVSAVEEAVSDGTQNENLEQTGANAIEGAISNGGENFKRIVAVPAGTTKQHKKHKGRKHEKGTRIKHEKLQ